MTSSKASNHASSVALAGIQQVSGATATSVSYAELQAGCSWVTAGLQPAHQAVLMPLATCSDTNDMVCVSAGWYLQEYLFEHLASLLSSALSQTGPDRTATVRCDGQFVQQWNDSCLGALCMCVLAADTLMWVLKAAGCGCFAGSNGCSKECCSTFISLPQGSLQAANTRLVPPGALLLYQFMLKSHC